MKRFFGSMLLAAVCGIALTARSEEPEFDDGAPDPAPRSEELSRTRDELKETRNELSRTRDELKETRNELAHSRNELKETRKELARTWNELKKKQDALTRTRRELGLTREQLEEARRQAETVRARNARAAEEAREKVRRLEAELDKVKRDYELLTREPYGKTALWRPGSPEARAHIAGRVISVNKEYGYLVIDLSTHTRAVQKIGDREHLVDPQLAEGMEMFVVRGDLNGATPPKFIARIKIRSVDGQCTVADLPNSENAIRAGDAVICAGDR